MEQIKEIYTYYSQNYLVDTDSRNIRSGSVFFALKGDRFDGNKYAKQALDSGAIISIIDDEKYTIEGKTILVNDVLETLQLLANYHRKQLSIPIVALTGSNGKTTTKELINEVLKTQFKTVATKGNLNNHIGVPLTLLSFDPTTEIGIVEMGANHQKEIEFLANIAEPDYGYITNFGKAHLEGFGGVEGVIKGKSELYHHLKDNDKIAFVNADDEKQVDITKNSKRILIEDEGTLLEGDSFLKIQLDNEVAETQLVGEYNFKNIRAAIAIGKYFKISTDNIKKAIESYSPTNNRSQIIETKENKILLDAYNANPSSMERALENFSKAVHPKKVVILGDMFELGEDAKKEHQVIANLSYQLGFSQTYLVGENFYGIEAPIKFQRFEDLENNLKSSPIKNSYILIKGSRGMALERLLETID